MHILTVDDTKYIVVYELSNDEQHAKNMKNSVGGILIRNPHNGSYFLCNKIEDIEYENENY